LSAEDPAEPEHRRELRDKARRLLAEVRQEGRDEGSLVEELEIHRAELAIQNEELRNAQNELLAACDRYRDLFERAPVGYLVLDRGGRIHEVNQCAAELLGGTKSELLESDLAGRIAPASQDTYFRHRRALVEGERRRLDELTLRTSGAAGPRIVRLETVAEPDGESDEARFRSALVDITDLRQTEQALQAERDRLEERVAERTRELEAVKAHREQLLDNLGEGLLGLDAEGCITFLNPRALQLLGYDRQQTLLGRDGPTVLQPEAENGSLIPEEACPVGRVLSTAEPAELRQCRFRCADGSPLPVAVHINPVHEGGELAGAVVLFAPRNEGADPRQQLSPREQEVADQLVAGATNKEAARRLNLSPRTVEAHRARIMDKLEVASFAELVQLMTG
jgi:PAS domain S-box-containing protein